VHLAHIQLAKSLALLGPRFTLKLEALQKGTFDSKGGEFEWLHKKDMDTSRRRFFL
jgi:ribosome production factor 1